MNERIVPFDQIEWQRRRNHRLRRVSLLFHTCVNIGGNGGSRGKEWRKIYNKTNDQADAHRCRTNVVAYIVGTALVYARRWADAKGAGKEVTQR